MADDHSKRDTLAALALQLDQSRQQQARLGDALTRVLSLVDDMQGPESPDLPR